MRFGLGHRLLHRLHDQRRRRAVGIADAEADHVHALPRACGDLALQLGERVRRDALQALTRSHPAPPWSFNVSSSAPAPENSSLRRPSNTGRAQPVRFTRRSSPTSTSSSPPSSTTVTRASHVRPRTSRAASAIRALLRARRRPRRRWRPCPRTASPPRPARRCVRGCAPPVADPPSSSVYQETFVRFGNSWVAFDRRADRPQVERRSAASSVDADRALGVADRDVPGSATSRPDRRSSSPPAVRAAPPGKSFEVSLALPMSTRHVSGPVIVGRISPAAVWIEKLVLLGPAAPAQVQDRLARAVARQLGLRAVGVEDPQVGHVLGVLAAATAQHPVGEHAEVAVAQPAHARGRELERQLVALDDQVVVAQRLPLLESHTHRRAESRISRGSPSSGSRPGHVDHAHAPRACASMSAGAWRSCACGASSPPRRLRAAPRSRAPCAPSPTRRRRCRASTSSRTPAASICLHARVDPRVQHLALHRQPDQQRRVAQLRAPQLRRPLRRLELPASSSSSARTTRWRSFGSMPSAAHAARRASRACSAGAPCRCSSAVQRSRAPSRRRRAQSSSVSAARRYSPVPPTTIGRRPACEQPVDLGVRELGVLPRAEGRVERQERHQAMLQLRALRRRRHAGERLEARVHLQRVGGHGDRVLTAGAQQLGQRDRDRGLADAGGSEQRDQLGSVARADVAHWLSIAAIVAHDRRTPRSATLELCECRSPAPPSCSPAPPAASARRSPGRCSARGGELILTGRRADVLEPLAAELGGARTLAVDLSEPPPSIASSPRPARSTSSWPTPRCPASGRLESFYDRGDRPRARRQPARSDRAGARARPGDGEAWQGHLLFMSSLCRQVGDARDGHLQRHQVRPARLRLGAARRPARQRRRRLGGLPRLHPRRGHVRRSGRQAPPGVGTAHSRGRRARGRRSDRAQPRRGRRRPPVPACRRASSPGIAPELAASVARRLGSEDIAREMEAAQRDKR